MSEMLHQCSGCENMCEIGEQYCTDCRYETALEDWIDAQTDYESDGSPMCVMCGKEWGTSKRKDGKYYCSECWMVWTS